ncbi:MAG: M23 family metallopeptidase [Gemmatimonadota bacterium]|nr:M23 family metallopeptidase [Gemmatimonadota bacterium]MDH5196922.1 M23 family metallopeptidase [Gemmatimonadota bacterium]
MTDDKAVTVVVHRDGDPHSRQFRLPLWVARTLLFGAGALGVGIILGGVLYAPIVRTASSVPGLRDRIARLEAERDQVQQLARRLDEAEQRYEQIREMMGGRIVLAMQTPLAEPVLAVAPIEAQPPEAPARFEDGLSPPIHWPLDRRGIITRGQVSPGPRDETHSGLDIAVPIGTPIRASGGGVVAELGEDAEYGLFVILDHPGDYQSLYGHASRLLISEGDTVAAGQVIALAGSTGRSTGPHLHFEIRRGARAIDPRTVVREAP